MGEEAVTLMLFQALRYKTQMVMKPNYLAVFELWKRFLTDRVQFVFFVPAEPSVYTGIVEDQTVAEVLYNGTLRSIKDVRSKKKQEIDFSLKGRRCLQTVKMFP